MEKNPDRKVKFWRGCKTKGLVDNLAHCGDKTCASCNSIQKTMLEVIEEQFKEMENEFAKKKM